jgi:hypothetical protein
LEWWSDGTSLFGPIDDKGTAFDLARSMGEAIDDESTLDLDWGVEL